MNESRPPGDTILIQIGWSTEPLAPHAEYSILPSNTEPYSGDGYGYAYLEAGKSIELDSGIGFLMSKHEVTYFGEGTVVINPLPRRLIGLLGKKEPTQTLRIENWNV
jgi:hypothetical protein